MKTNQILFIDCDDTLVLWHDIDGKVDSTGPHPYGSGAEGYELNAALIVAINLWKAKTGGAVVVWSGGGDRYAKKWADESGLQYLSALSKDPRVPKAGDICVDDDLDFFRSSQADVMTYREFVEVWDE